MKFTIYILLSTALLFPPAASAAAMVSAYGSSEAQDGVDQNQGEESGGDSASNKGSEGSNLPPPVMSGRSVEAQ